MTASQPTTGVLLTPVVDLLSLLIVGFLGLGVLIGVVGRIEHPAGAESSGPAQLAIAAAEREAEVARLRGAAAAVAAQAERRVEVDREAAALAGEEATLRAAIEARRRLLAELEIAVAEAGRQQYGLAAGAPMVRKDRVADEQFGVMLTWDRVIPLSKPYVAGQALPNGSTAVWPVKAGLSVEEALRRGSPLMNEVTTATFRRRGRVVMLVTPDSFAAFRALRDGLLRLGVDYGWEPMADRTVVFTSASGAREVDSQAPGR